MSANNEFPSVQHIATEECSNKDSSALSVLDRVKHFLPKIAEANAKLNEKQTRTSHQENEEIIVEETRHNYLDSDDEDETSTSDEYDTDNAVSTDASEDENPTKVNEVNTFLKQ